ncbi:MAG: lamin tail domain-containing protein [Myxococcales bacterium]|nr:lamin tail domain-containing protein [Myxococcales bacterium]
MPRVVTWFGSTLLCIGLSACAQGRDLSPSSSADPNGGAGPVDIADAGSETGDSGPVDLPPGNPPGSDASVDTGMPPAPSDCAPVVGDLVITEVMIASQSGSSDRGEWFEVQSRRACALDLGGLEIVSPTSGGNEKSHTVAAGTTAGPGEAFVFALSADASENHGLEVDYVYANGSYSDVVMNNGDDWLELRAGGTVIDRVSWTAGQYTVGKSRSFPSSLSDGDNDDWSKWCDAVDVYSTQGGTFLGTPGAANPATCP